VASPSANGDKRIHALHNLVAYSIISSVPLLGVDAEASCVNLVGSQFTGPFDLEDPARLMRAASGQIVALAATSDKAGT
jgi:hypothetical protein